MKKLVLLSLITLAVGVGCSSKDKKAAGDKATAAASSKKSSAKKSVKRSAKKAIKKGSETAAQSLTCKLNEYSRELAIEKPADGGCEVLYTKDDNTKSIATGNGISGYCQQVFDRVKGKLESAGFSCN